MAVAITRMDHDALGLRQAAVRAKDADAARRMLALALVLEGRPRMEAAHTCGMDRQTLRDWVHRYNDAGLVGLREQPARLVFVDETAVTTKMTRSRGRSRRGWRLPGAAPFGHWMTQTFIAALRCDALTAPWVVDKAMDRAAFDAWIETQLAPTLRLGDVVVLDNLPVHKSARAAAMVRDRGAWLLFLPPYSPDLNPIEMAFAKLKAHLRAAGARSFDALWRAVGKACDLFSPQQCWNFCKAAGYASN